MEGIAGRSQSSGGGCSPGKIFPSRQMPTVDPRFKRNLAQLFCGSNPWIYEPTVAGALADILAMAAIHIGRRKPGSTAGFAHVDAIVVVGQLELATIFAERAGYRGCV